MPPKSTPGAPLGGTPAYPPLAPQLWGTLMYSPPKIGGAWGPLWGWGEWGSVVRLLQKVYSRRRGTKILHALYGVAAAIAS